MRQLIIARKDLNMSAGKLAAQGSHAALSFLTMQMRNKKNIKKNKDGNYAVEVEIDADTYENWICGTFTKTVCEAKNRNQLLKAKTIAEGLGLVEGKDFFLIKDNCLTELEPEEIDENDQGRTLTCIGFRPLPDEVAHKISKKFQLYR